MLPASEACKAARAVVVTILGAPEAARNKRHDAAIAGLGKYLVMTSRSVRRRCQPDSKRAESMLTGFIGPLASCLRLSPPYNIF